MYIQVYSRYIQVSPGESSFIQEENQGPILEEFKHNGSKRVHGYESPARFPE